jgi:predicted DNA-binding protein
MLGEHTRSSAEAFGKHTAQLNQVLANNSAMMQQTANQVGAQSKEAVTILTSQTQTLREVSRGLLDQIHGLTQRFENQGQAILTAAKALDSSNTKIDSILEGRHQAIIALLHTVNTKAQDLDNMMRSYAGMVENAMSQAEQRAKQVGTALARDTASQAQQALTQIERLREEAQAHTQRAVSDLKGSFEQIITQIGRQLEQMRGTFDNTSRGMREVAQKTATDLDGLRTEMQKRMESLPEQTAQAAEAVRKALSEQIKEIEAQSVAAQQAAGSGRTKPFELPPCAPRHEAGLRRIRSAVPPRLRRDGPPDAAKPRRPRPCDGRPCSAIGEPLAAADASSSGLTRAAAALDPGRSAIFSPAPRMRTRVMRRAARASAPAPQPRLHRLRPGGQLRLDEIARAIDYRTAVDVWQRFRTGERGVLGRHIYSAEGQATFDEVSRRYDREADFRGTVDRYIGDFERLLGEAEASDPEGACCRTT